MGRVPSHGVGIGAADPVVALAHPHASEAETAVPRDRRFVVGAHLQVHHRLRADCAKQLHLAFVRDVYARLYPFDPEFGSDAIAALDVNSARTPA